MILTLTIKLAYGYDAQAWKATLEIGESATLEDLHQAIQKAVDFDDDHLYEFYIARTDSSRERIRFDDENKGLYKFTLNSIFPLEEGKKCFYLFDYGDNWLFQITASRKKPFPPVADIKYPRVIAESGTKPEQYPDWDDDEDEDDESSC